MVSALGVDAGPGAGADRRDGGHGLLLNPWGRCRDPCRRGGWCSSAWFVSCVDRSGSVRARHGCAFSAQRVDAGTRAGAKRGDRGQSLLLSRAGRCTDRGRHGGWCSSAWLPLLCRSFWFSPRSARVRILKPSGSMQTPVPARSVVIVVRPCSSAERVDVRTEAGTYLRGGAHDRSPGTKWMWKGCGSAAFLMS
jgi:hypothetical protein